MNALRNQNSKQRVEDGPKHCCWMQAGVVDYKLCDLDYDCDNCPFDLALHRTTLSPSSAQTAEARTYHKRLHEQSISVHGCQIETSLFYHLSHAWVRVEDGGGVRTGLDDFGQWILGRPYLVDLPAVGTQVRCGESCWRYTHKVGETVLVSPVSGTIKEINGQLTQYPALLNRDPYGLGWTFLIEPEDLNTSLKELMYGQRVTDWCEQECQTLSQLLSQVTNNEFPLIGQTMGDGGFIKNDFSADLNTEQIRSIINSFFPISVSEQERKRKRNLS